MTNQDVKKAYLEIGMTNQEKDLKNAREYLDNELPELKQNDYVIYGHEDLNGYCIDELLANHVQWLEQKGVIKFNENRL